MREKEYTAEKERLLQSETNTVTKKQNLLNATTISVQFLHKQSRLDSQKLAHQVPLPINTLET